MMVENEILGEPSTVLGLAVKIWLSFSGPEVPLPLQNIILGILEDEDPIDTPTQHVQRGAAAVTVNAKTICLKFFRRYPEI